MNFHNAPVKLEAIVLFSVDEEWRHRVLILLAHNSSLCFFS